MNRLLAILALSILLGYMISRTLSRARASPLGRFLTAVLGGGPSRSDSMSRNRPEPASRDTARDRASIALARCAGCGTHVPSDRCTRVGEDLFCPSCG